MSDLFGNHIVGFPTRRLIIVAPVSRVLASVHSYQRQNAHYENLPMQYTVISKVVKNETFQ